MGGETGVSISKMANKKNRPPDKEKIKEKKNKNKNQENKNQVVRRLVIFRVNCIDVVFVDGGVVVL